LTFRLSSQRNSVRRECKDTLLLQHPITKAVTSKAPVYGRPRGEDAAQPHARRTTATKDRRLGLAMICLTSCLAWDQMVELLQYDTVS
jgi:hypothetical protein